VLFEEELVMLDLDTKFPALRKELLVDIPRKLLLVTIGYDGPLRLIGRLSNLRLAETLFKLLPVDKVDITPDTGDWKELG